MCLTNKASGSQTSLALPLLKILVHATGRENMPSEADLAWRELNVSKFHDRCQWRSGWRNRVWVWVPHMTCLYVILFIP